MAGILTAQQIEDTWKNFIADTVRSSAQPVQFNQIDLRAAVSAIDAWITANQASLVAALPDPFKTNATSTQKTALFMYVLSKRYLG